MLLYIPTNMQESIHHSLAIVFSGIFYKLIKNDSTTSRTFVFVSLLLMIFASLIRPTWALLFIPFYILKSGEITRRSIILAYVHGALMILPLFMLNMWYSAPYPNFVSNLLTTFNNSMSEGLKLFSAHVITNLKLMIVGFPLEKVQRAQVLLVIIISVVSLIPLLIRRVNVSQTTRVTYFHLLNLGLILVFNILFYDMSLFRDYRLIAPNLLLSLLLSIALSENLLPYIIMILVRKPPKFST